MNSNQAKIENYILSLNNEIEDIFKQLININKINYLQQLKLKNICIECRYYYLSNFSIDDITNKILNEITCPEFNIENVLILLNKLYYLDWIIKIIIQYKMLCTSENHKNSYYYDLHLDILKNQPNLFKINLTEINNYFVTNNINLSNFYTDYTINYL